jgi:hypothetical protein
MGSIPSKGDHPVLTAILSTLDVDSRDEYDALEADFAMKTTQLQRKETYYDGSELNRYSQLVFRVTDSMGNELSDYAIELIDGSGSGAKLPGGFFGDKHKNAVNPEQFVYYLDYDTLSEVRGGKFGFRVHTAAATPLINYEELVFSASTGADSIIKPNQTTFVDAVLKRRINKNVFRITDDFSYQKITNAASEEWVE